MSRAAAVPARRPAEGAGAPVPSGRVLVIVGPTASGKSALALEVSRIVPCEIVSADSRQVYRGMAVGTAQPSAGELEAVRHHFVGSREPDRPVNAGEFGDAGRAAIRGIMERGRLPVVVGGSGLYVRSLVRGFFDGPGAVRELREELEARCASRGPESLLAELRELDPAAAESLRPADTRRIVRALEVCLLSGTPVSELRRTGIPIPFTPVLVGLRWPRSALYDRINARAIGMVNAGLVEETRRLLDLGYGAALAALRTVGYVEAVDHLAGRIGRAEMVARIQMNTRRFAKRQLTWFRAERDVRWIDVGSEQEFPRAAREAVAGLRAAGGGGTDAAAPVVF